MKVAVIRLSSLGDIAIMLPMLCSLKRGLEDCTLHVVTGKPFNELLERLSCIDKLVTLRDGSLPSLISLVRVLNSERYDVIVDAHNVLRSNIIFRSLRAPVKIQLEKEPLKKSALIYLKMNLYNKQVSLYEKYMKIAEKLGVDQADNTIELSASREEEESIYQVLVKHHLDGIQPVAVAPGARWKTKIWPPDRFGVLVRMLRKEGLNPVLIGGESDLELCKRVIETAGIDVPNLSGKLSAAGTALFLKRCRVLVTNDSAPLHLAELVQTPVVALYGPTVREFGYFPRLRESIALEKEMWCRPCSRNGSRFCPTGTSACMKSIGVEEVYQAVIGVLSGGTENRTQGKRS